MVKFTLTKAVQLEILKSIESNGMDITYQDIDRQLRLLLVQIRDSAELKAKNKIYTSDLPW